MKSVKFSRLVAALLMLLCLFSCTNSTESVMKYPTPTLKGIVEIPAEAGIKPTDVKVNIEGLDGDYRVNPDGTWMIPGLEEGKSYTVYFSANVKKNTPARDISLLDDDDDDDDDDYWADRIEDAVAQHGSEIMDYIAQLTRAWTVKGNVSLRDESDHSGIMVYIPGTQYIAITDKAGNYTIKGIPEGKNYEMAYSKQDWTTARSVKFNLEGKTEGKRIRTLESVIMNYSYGKIAGNITFENPESATEKQWSVYAFNKESGATPYYPVLDGNSYLISNLKEGIYKVYLVDSSGTSLVSGDVAVSGGKTAEADFFVPNFSSYISGKIQATGISDFSEVCITLESNGKTLKPSVPANGEFKASVLPGEWSWSISLNGFETKRGTVTVGSSDSSIGIIELKKSAYQSTVTVSGNTKLILEGDVFIPWYIEIAIGGKGVSSSIFSIDFNKGGFAPREIYYEEPTELSATINKDYQDYFIKFSTEKVMEGNRSYTLVHCTLDRNFGSVTPALIKVVYDFSFELAANHFKGVWISERGVSCDDYHMVMGLVPLYNDRAPRTIKVVPGSYAMNGNNTTGGRYPIVSPVEYRRNAFKAEVGKTTTLTMKEAETPLEIVIPGFTGKGVLIYEAKSGQDWPPRGGGIKVNGSIKTYAEFGKYDISFYPEEDKTVRYFASCNVQDMKGERIELRKEKLAPEVRLSAEGKYYNPGESIRIETSLINISNPTYKWSIDGKIDESQTAGTFMLEDNKLEKGGHRITLEVSSNGKTYLDYRDIVISPEKVNSLEINGETQIHYRQDVFNQLDTVVSLNIGKSFRLWGDYDITVNRDTTLEAVVSNNTDISYTYYLVGYSIGEERHVDVVLDRDIANPSYVKVKACDMFNPNKSGARGIWFMQGVARGVDEYLGFPIMANYDTRTFKVEDGYYNYTGNWGSGDHYVQYKTSSSIDACGGNTAEVALEIDYFD